MNSTNDSQKTRKLRSMLSGQEELILSMRRELDDIDADGLIAENERLRKELQESRADNERLARSEAETRTRLETTKRALFARMANEKLAAFKRAKASTDAIYYTGMSRADNRLLLYKNECQHNIDMLNQRIDTLGREQYADISGRLSELTNEVEQRHNALMEQKAREEATIGGIRAEHEKRLRSEELTDTEKRVALKQKSLESFIGLNVLSKAGIVLFLIGIISLGRFAYTRLPDLFKALLIYALAGVLIAVGELFHKKEKTVFSTALLSGGVAVLYAAVATGYFALGIVSVEVTFALCIAVTAVAIALSAQVKSQVVCAFAAVGGYLPLVATYMIGFGNAVVSKPFLPVSSVYFCLLAVVLLIMTNNKRWQVAQFIGYAFQVLALVGVSRCAWVLRDASGFGFVMPMAAVFAVVSFVIFMLMPASGILSGRDMSSPDNALLALNTVSGAASVSFTVSGCFASAEYSGRIAGIVFAVFTAIYALLVLRARSVSSSNSGARVSRIILCAGALIFSLMVAPLAFGWHYAGIAWAVEGAVIAVIAVGAQRIAPQIAGIACMIGAPISLMAYVNDYGINMITDRASVVALAIMLVCCWAYVVRGLLAVRGDSAGGAMSVVYIIMELAAAVFSVSYLCYLYSFTCTTPMVQYGSRFTDIGVYLLAAMVVIAVMQMPVMRNRASLVTSATAQMAVLLLTAGWLNTGHMYNAVTDYLGAAVTDATFRIGVNIVLMLVVNIAGAVMLGYIVSRLLNEFDLPVWIYTITISVSALLLITTMLMGQFGMKFSNVAISAIYIAVACALLLVGFRRQYTVVRAGGLVLILCALAKLCFVDTHALDKVWKIGAYFAFGAVLFVISYFYQRFNKRLEADTYAAVTAEATDE